MSRTLICDQCGLPERDDYPFAVRGGQAGYYDFCTRQHEQDFIARTDDEHATEEEAS